jgi:hypothetical protein
MYITQFIPVNMSEVVYCLSSDKTVANPKHTHSPVKKKASDRPRKIDHEAMSVEIKNRINKRKQYVPK